ncbi:hypothetical protein T12_13202 [Trichinella patagoniensis]|uniref:Uncharacterized protein n=1 Tax=Trichinella patagoniensis TaxID=990121 RepID=A0A0V0Z9F1_9BILA|nr:hypothetical protein T12_13202 [Trichinella patagoniensis]
MDVISGLFWLLNLLHSVAMAAAPMSKLNFTSQTNDAHEKFPDEFSHSEISRQSCWNPPIAMLLRKSNAVRWEKWKCLICNASGCFTNAPNYRDLKHDPSIAIQFRYSNVIHCEKIEVADLQSILTFLEDMDLLIFGDFTKQNYQNLKHDPSIAVLSRKSNAIRWERWMLPIYRESNAMWCGVEVDDLQSLMFFEILDLIGELAHSDETTHFNC